MGVKAIAYNKEIKRQRIIEILSSTKELMLLDTYPFPRKTYAISKGWLHEVRVTRSFKKRHIKKTGGYVVLKSHKIDSIKHIQPGGEYGSKGNESNTRDGGEVARKETS